MPRTRSASLLLLTVLSLIAAPLLSQAPPSGWRLEGGPAPVVVREAIARGYAALPASTLVSLGAQLGYEGQQVVATLGAAEVRFTVGSAQVKVGNAERTLSNPVYSEGGVVYVPADFFRRFLAEASGGALEVEPAARTIRRVAAPAVAVAEAPARPQAPAARTVAEHPRVRRLVVVDAGHGGVDPGARGPNGTREKDVTLQMARRVAALLREDPTLDVRMTRDRDTLIGLYDRPRFANRWRAEGQPAVFISIHCNANESRSEKGFETYFLSEARTADARRVEEFENASVQYEERAAGGTPLGFILTDLRQNHYLRESSEWAQMIQDRLGQIHYGPDRGAKQAGFAVLRGTYMPAVLVEIGFISNAREEGILTDADMQHAIAVKLADAVKAYFDRPSVRPESD